MAFTTTQLEALEAAIASGELSVNYEGKSVTYRSMADLRAAYELVRDALIAAGTISGSTPPRSYTAFSRD